VSIRFDSCGLPLAADVAGDWSGPAVLLLHGGGQTRHSWDRIARVLADRGYLAVSLDARGHGESGWSPEGEYKIDDFVDDIRAVAVSLNRPVALVGASLGGASSLLAAAEEPKVSCSAVVLVDVTPRTNERGRTMVLEFLRANPDGFASLDDAADSVADYLPHRSRPSDNTGLAKNLRRGEDGRYRWHWDPAFLDGGLTNDVLRYERFETAARLIDVPCLLVRGEMSSVVTQNEVASFRSLMPDAEYVSVANADHMVPGDQNDAFLAAVLDFLDRQVLLKYAPWRGTTQS
jgi:pimeloyl-ACP methyl ester carboxylesterase